MLQRHTSSPIRPVSYIDVPKITHYQQQQQQWSQDPLISPSILPFELGSTIEDPVRKSSYTLIQPLGNGSYAVVYMVLNKKDNKYYALKCLSKANLNEYYLAIQQNEVLIHEKVNGHPNLVRLHHTFETPDWLFLVMEYCEGQDLYFWLTKNQDHKDAKTGRQYTENERLELVKQVFMQILDAVGHCHSNGIAHRDLKPENFIVTVDRESGNVLVQLTDFGLATDELESTDFDCGSKPYMSYECRNPVRETYHPRLGDIWSLGIIFLNLLYHRSPWSDPNPEQCKSFADFQRDKIDFLMQQFKNMPESVAHFLSTRVFCRPEEGRISIREWKVWCKNLVQKLLNNEEEEEEYCEVDHLDLHELTISAGAQVNDEEDSSKEQEQQHGYARKKSWSDVFEESLDKEMDFTAPVVFLDEMDNCQASIENNQSRENKAAFVETTTEVPFFEVVNENNENKQDEEDQQQADANAINSDADSGFGTDEDINGNVMMRRVRAQQNSTGVNDNGNMNASLSTTPPKVIYCRPRPWGEECNSTTSIENSHMQNNDHWNSYNLRRERLERRKEKEKKNQFTRNRRRGSSVGAQDALSFSGINSFPRRVRPRRLSQDRVLYFKANVTPPTKNAPPPSPKRNNHSSTDFVSETYVPPSNPERRKSFALVSDRRKSLTPVSNRRKSLTPITTSFDAPTHPQRRISREDLSEVEKSPKMVTKSTKNSLTKMLEKMVIFNRGIKIGGQDKNIM